MSIADTSQTDYAGQVFKNLPLNGETITAKEFYECVFEACSLAETFVEQCRFVDCIFKHCDLSLLHLPGASFANTQFQDCKMVGLDWTEAAWPKGKNFHIISFSKCVINHSTFIGLDLPEIKIIECLAHDVDFREANLSRANFSHTDLAGSLFIHSNLTQADFSKAKNYTIDAGLNTLKEAKFSLPEAMSLLHSLDIVLTE